MRRSFLLFLILVVAGNGFAQFKIDNNQADAYLRRKAEEAQTRRVQDSIRQAQWEEQQMMASDIRYKIKWVNMLTFKQAIGFMENSYNLSYYGYFKTKKVWTYPINIKLSGSRGYNASYIREGYKDWSQNLSYWGISGFRNLKDNWYLSLGGHLPLGWERYRNASDSDTAKRHLNLLFGLNAEERLFYMSPTKTGLVLGFGLYQRVLNSKVYTLDTGFSLEVGLKF